MAVIHTGSIVSDIRGSVGTETYSRNQGGLYVRTRTGPGGVPTPKQIAITDTLTALSRAWSDTLTQQQRDDWESYARQHPLPNRWGTKSLANGYTRFIANNFPEYHRLTALTYPDAPTAPPLPMPAFAFTISDTIPVLTVTLPFTIPLPNDSTLRAYLYLSPMQSIGVNYFSAPFAYASTALKTAGNWAPSPWTTTPDYDWGVTFKIFARLRVQDALTGAISTPGQAFDTVTTLPPP